MPRAVSSVSSVWLPVIGGPSSRSGSCDRGWLGWFGLAVLVVVQQVAVLGSPRQPHLVALPHLRGDDGVLLEDDDFAPTGDADGVVRGRAEVDDVGDLAPDGGAARDGRGRPAGVEADLLRPDRHL